MALRACLLLLVVGMAACGSGDTPAPEGVATVIVDTPQGDLQITLAPTTAQPEASAPAETTTTIEEDPNSQPTAEADPEPPSARLVEPARLEPGPEVWGGYDRDLFPHWSDLDGDGCDTRQEVLIRDSAIEPVMHPERICRVVDGRWWSSYDDTWTSNPASLHIDHLVPLAEAWESGARLWSAEQREAFANDMTGLIAVSAAANTSKGASDPAEWLPQNEDVRCIYGAVWIEVKATWGLTADPAEIDALEALAAVCG
ncbi:MAG: HNH endonuclease family protein [bacterium]|nr:HNH endonuclease family protein [bacterium]MDE0288178.1 HNH endonuclease family protein [bacterium]MDE0437663.1 HNH endonuclease family protein [bacterium]